MGNDAPKLRVYNLGTGYATTCEGQSIFSWPYRVDYTPGHRSGDFYLGQGDVRNGGGSFVFAAEVLQPPWRGYLDYAGAVWLVPLLERMARGEDVSPADVLDAYRQVHGTLPPSEE